MSIGQEPVGGLDMMLFVSRASPVSSQLGQGELAAIEQGVHELHQGALARPVPDHRVVAQPL
jgi:hypothetical protein